MSVQGEHNKYQLSIIEPTEGRGKMANIHRATIDFKSPVQRNQFADELTALMKKYEVKCSLEYNTVNNRIVTLGG